MMLMGVFAALALGLSALGIYSVLSYSVNQRRQELSVRMALGAQPRDVLWLVVRQGLWLALIGGAAGAAGALAIGRALSSLLYGVSAGDAPAFARRDRARGRHRARARACCPRAAPRRSIRCRGFGRTSRIGRVQEYEPSKTSVAPAETQQLSSRSCAETTLPS